MALTLKQLTDETLRKLQGYGLVQPRATFLTSDVTSSSLLWSVTSTADISQGLAEVDGELVFVESVDDDSNTITIAPDGRGYYGTTAAAHLTNARLTIAPVWPRIDVEDALNQAIVNTYPDLFGVGTTSFTFNASVFAYSLPADVESVLKVTADTIGPSKVQQEVRRYSFNSVAPVADFPNGNSLTLGESVFPGQLVTVTYVKVPTTITASDLLSVSGLRDTAKTALIYAACSHLLAYLDPSRLNVDAAQADEYDTRNAVGTAQKIANNLYARYEIELDRERRRLRATTPVPINVRR